MRFRDPPRGKQEDVERGRANHLHDESDIAPEQRGQRIDGDDERTRNPNRAHAGDARNQQRDGRPRSGFELEADDEGGYGTQDYPLGPQGGYGQDFKSAPSADRAASNQRTAQASSQFVDRDFGRQGWQEPARYVRGRDERDVRDRSVDREDDDHRNPHDGPSRAAGADAYLGRGSVQQRSRGQESRDGRSMPNRSNDAASTDGRSTTTGTQQGYGGTSFDSMRDDPYPDQDAQRGSRASPGDLHRDLSHETRSAGYAQRNSRSALQGRVGPKGYARSDERLLDDVCERLLHDYRVNVEHVSVRVQDGVATLEGHVPERRMRYLIEDVVDDVYGIRDVENHVRVARAQDLQSQNAQAAKEFSSSSPSSDAPTRSLGENVLATGNERRGSSADNAGKATSGTSRARGTMSSSGESQTSIGAGPGSSSNGTASSGSNGAGAGTI